MRLQVFLVWLLLCGLYLCLAGALAAEEVIAAALVGAAGAWLTVRVHRLGFFQLRLRPRWLRPSIYLPWSTLQDTWMITAVLWECLRHPRRSGQTLEFAYEDAGGEEGEGRKALMIYAVCITPNEYVLEVPPGRQKVMIRILVGRKLSKSDRLFVEQT